MNLLEHLEELRIRLVVVGLSFLIIFMVFIAISPLAAQLLSKSTGIDFVTLHPAEAVIAYVRLALFLAVLAVMPIALYHLYLFIAPALRRAELRAALITLPFSVVMFYAGVLFGYAVIVRLGLPFLAMLSTRAGLTPLWSFDSVVDYIVFSCLVMGLVFQMPIVMIWLSRLGLLSPARIRAAQRHVIIACFVLAAVITPTLDIFSQVLVAVPLIILFEISIVLARLLRGASR